MTQAELDFEAKVADIAKERAIDAAESGADPDWLTAALRAVLHLARRTAEFTTDDVWRMIDHLEAPREPRALGAVMREARRNGWVQPTDRTRKSVRAKCHCRPVRVWRSQL